MIHHLEVLNPTRKPPLDLREMNELLEGAPVSNAIAWAHQTFGAGLVMATGFGPSGVVLAHHVAEMAIDLRVFYIDTSLLFPATYRLKEALSERLGIAFEPISGIDLERQSTEYGPELWSRNPDRCCHIRKVTPLREYLKGKTAWITGLRRDQSDGRSDTQIVEWDQRNGLYKLNPLAAWTSDDVWGYIREHRLPYNDLHDEGYPSIGCEPCTRNVAAGEDERAGRWAGTTKTECGMHQRREVA